jgi:hypothetical protein
VAIPYDQTELYKRVLCSPRNAAEASLMEELRAALASARKRVIPLLGLIPRDIPGLTIHDISHIDALWGIAGEIAGTDYPINPLEGYVLGAAFLFHDAGMTIASFPNGITELKETEEWKDAIANRRSQSSSLSDADERQLIAEVLRIRHGRQAESLATCGWPSPEGGEVYIIENEDLRTTYGELIGRIAHSHNWDIERLRTDLPGKLGSLGGFPNDWTIDPLKLAGILRIADAAHINSERAPRFHRTAMRPVGISDDHWNFQSRMLQPYCDQDALVFTSRPFGVSDVSAWWLASKAIGILARELREINELFEDTGTPDTPRGQFRIRRVKGSESTDQLAKVLPTSGWWPVDTSIQITDPLSFVESFGGRELYGDRPQIVLRELLQNSVDAVEARRQIDPAWTAESGKILVRLSEDDAVWKLQVLDNGIGMSRRTLTGALLDFGKSFWRSTAVQEEFPGLQSSSFSPVGKFGIGFFSVFMLANQVRVVSRRFDRKHEQGWALTFTQGLRVPAILSRDSATHGLGEWSTCVELQLTKARVRSLAVGGSIEDSATEQGFPKSFLAQSVVYIAPATSVSIQVDEPFTSCTIPKDFWQHCSDAAFATLLNCFDDSLWSGLQAYLAAGFHRFTGRAKTEYSLMREGRGASRYVVGRGALFPMQGRREGFHIVRGFRGESTSWCSGFVAAETHVASRLETSAILSELAIKEWANEQIETLSERSIPPSELIRFSGAYYLRLANIVRRGHDISSVPLIPTDRGALSLRTLANILKAERCCFIVPKWSYDKIATLDDFRDKWHVIADLRTISARLDGKSRSDRTPAWLDAFKELSKPKERSVIDAYVDSKIMVREFADPSGAEEKWMRDYRRRERRRLEAFRRAAVTSDVLVIFATSIMPPDIGRKSDSWPMRMATWLEGGWGDYELKVLRDFVLADMEKTFLDLELVHAEIVICDKSAHSSEECHVLALGITHENVRPSSRES